MIELTSTKDLYQLRVDNLKIKIEQLQRGMNKRLSNGRCIREIEKKQSILRVEMILWEDKIRKISEKFKHKAA